MNEDWRALGAEAARFLREGQWSEAATTLARLLEVNPDHADSWFNLGYALRHARRYGDALHAYGKAIALGVRRPEEAHLNRAVILSEHLHDNAGAQSELEQAITANPDFTPAWLNLGNLQEDLGDMEKARGAYEAALRTTPGNGRAIARLGLMQAHQGDPQAALLFLESPAASVRPDSEDQAEFLFARGNILDACGQHRLAFSDIAKANAIATALRPAPRKYDRSRQEALVDALIETFDGPAPASDSDPPAVFICGMFRSGSTLTEQMLARHSAVSAGGELEFVPALIAEELQPYPQAAASLPEDRVRTLRDKYVDQLAELFPNATVVTDKRPDNFLHIGLIKTLFPNARIIHTVRNPLDNILSAYFLYFSESIPYSESLSDIGHYYAQYRRLMDHWLKLYGKDIFTVDYDRLVAEPRSVLAPLIEFLRLDWEDECLDQKPSGSTVRTASVWQVRKPLHSKSSGRWRNYASELEDCRRELAKLGLIGDAD